MVVRIARAKFKPMSELGVVEKCCDEAVRLNEEQSEEFTIDLDIVGYDYSVLAKGHCGQELPYDRWVMAVDEKGNFLGKVPFDIIDIDEAITK